MSIQISGPVVLPDGSVTAVKIDSGAAPDGQVLTADGAGGVAWEAAAAGGPGYLEYVALLTQIGISNPVATVLKNTLGGTVVWTRNDPGSYVGTLANAFPLGKVLILPGSRSTANINGSWASTVEMAHVTENEINVLFITTEGPADDLPPVGIEIRVYP